MLNIWHFSINRDRKSSAFNAQIGKIWSEKGAFRKTHELDNAWTELVECKGNGEDNDPGVGVVVGWDFQVQLTPYAKVWGCQRIGPIEETKCYCGIQELPEVAGDEAGKLRQDSWKALGLILMR